MSEESEPGPGAEPPPAEGNAPSSPGAQQVGGYTPPQPPPFISMPPGFALPGLPVGAVAGLSLQQVQVWQGQFPPPDAVERYEVALPGSFDRIIRMAERQLDASVEGASEARHYLREDSRRGHWLGWSVTVAALAGAVTCAFIGQPWVAGALVAVPVMGVAKALIDSSQNKPAAPAAVSTQPPSASTPSTPSTPDAPAPGQ